MDAECWQVRDVFGTLFFRQLKQADTIILNKIDLLKKDDIPGYLMEIHQEIPHAQVIPAVNCRIDPEVVWFKSEQQDAHKNASDESRHQHGNEIGPFRQYGKIYTDTDFVTFSFSESAPLDEPAFNQFVQDMPKELFRLKGTVHYGDRTMMVNSVGGKTEWGLWDGTAETRLAFVGWNIVPDVYLTKLKACIRH
jgi:G3E family GTPase